MYMQRQMDEESRKLTTINVENGLHCYNCLPFGIVVTPAIFERTMENILQGMPKVILYIDHILAMRPTEKRYLNNLEAVV